MGSNNLKVNKKTKFKKLKKTQRINKANRTKFSAPELSIEPNFVNTFSRIQDSFINPLCDKEIYSRFYINDDDIPKIKKFTQVREQYLGYLQTVIKNNCAYYGSPVTEDILNSLSLKLEQHALLSSLQIDIYENFLTEIISDIEKCTKERQIHNEVQKLLPDSEDKEAVTSNKFNENSSESEKRLTTTEISNSTDGNLNENEITLEDQSVFDSETLDQCPSQQYSEPCTVPQDRDQLSSLTDIKTDDDDETALNDNSKFIRKEPESLQSNEVDILQASPSIREVSSPLQNENESSNKSEDLNFIPLSSQDFVDNETCDTVGEFSKVIQKYMEHIFSQNEISDEPLEENDRRANIIQLLQGEKASDERIDNSDNENRAEGEEHDQEENENINEEKENINGNESEEQMESDIERNLADRLEKMRSFFNIDERRPKRKVTVKVIKRKKSKQKKKKKRQRRLKRLNAWKNEKRIQLYKVSVLSSRLSYEKRDEMQKIFFQLFGEDSDEEHEFEYGSSDQFRTSCIERISSWVVKYLMPFYHKRRIIGRKVFKSLGRHISEAIIDKVPYPDERTVKYFVRKFFPPNKRYGYRSKRHRG